jgi:vesicle-fusing ATPase
VVIDSIENIVEWVPIGPRFSNGILQTLITLLRKQPPMDRKLLILATTSDRSLMQQLSIWNNFSSDIPVGNVNTYQELQYIMDQSGAFSQQEIQGALREIQEITSAQEVGVGIKRVLLAIETAKQDVDKASRFAGVMGRAIAER